MQKIYTVLLAFVTLLFFRQAAAQQLLVQDFNFSGALTANGWTAHSSAGTSPVSTTTGLSYTGYAGSGVGNAALVASVAGEDVNIGFTSQNTNGQSVYFAFLVNVNDAGTSKSGDYFFHTGAPANPTSFSTFSGRVFARIVSGNVNFGLSNSATATWGPTNFLKNTTYLLVMKYTINTSGNDAVSLWVLPSGVPASEAAAGTAEVVNTTTSGTDAVSAVALRQGSTSQPQTVVDGIRVGNTWTDAVQSGNATNGITTGTVSPTAFCVEASTSAAGTVDYSATGTYNTTFTAYLSDVSGSFASPTTIGSATVNGTDPSGTISITISAGTTSGMGYKIRVDATSLAITGTASAAFEIVNGAKNVSGATASGGNAQATINWTLPTACYDEVMVVAKAASSVAAAPTGDGSAYTASAAFGSGTAFDGGYVVYKGSGTSQTVTALTNGTLYYFKIFTRKGTAWSTGVEVSTTPNAVAQVNAGDIAINQLSPQYSGASDEYIELVNKTNNSLDLTGLVIRYQSSGGSPAGGNLLATLSGTIGPKRYWLLSPNATITVGQTNGVARDGASTAGMAAAAGQIALIRTSDGVIIDGVGYGNVTGGTYYETAAAPAPPTNGGIRRSPNGADNNNNSTDFVTVANANIFLRSNGTGAPLPVRFTYLKAEQRGAPVYVSWSCASEGGIREYLVERSDNGVDFSAFAKVNAAGSGQEPTGYTIVDASPVKGTNYYRIRCTADDGKQSFSSVLKFNTTGAVGLLVYPNPVRGTNVSLQVNNLPAGNYAVRIIDAAGRILLNKSASFSGGVSLETLPVNALPPGIYTVQVTGAVKLQQTFTKED